MSLSFQDKIKPVVKDATDTSGLSFANKIKPVSRPIEDTGILDKMARRIKTGAGAYVDTVKKVAKGATDLIAETKPFKEAAAGLNAENQSFGTHTAKFLFDNSQSYFNKLTNKLGETKFFQEAAAGIDEGSVVGIFGEELAKNIVETGKAFSGRGGAHVIKTIIEAPLNFATRSIYGKSNPLGDFLGDFADEMQKRFTTEKTQKIAEQPFGLEKIKNPDFWLTTVAENIPVTLAFMKIGMPITERVSGVVGGLLGTSTFAKVAAPVIGAIAGSAPITALEAAAEAEDAYHQAKQKGMGEKESVAAGANVFKNNIKLLSFTNSLEMATALMPHGLLGTSIIGKILAEAAGFGLQAVSEGGEEVAQYHFQESATGNKMSLLERLNDPMAQESGFIGAVMGILFQAGGRVVEHEAKKIQNAYFESIAGKLPPEDKDKLNQAQGVEEKQKVLDEIATTKPQVIEQAVTAIEREYQATIKSTKEIIDAVRNVPTAEKIKTELENGKTPAEVAFELSGQIGAEEASKLVEQIAPTVKTETPIKFQVEIPLGGKGAKKAGEDLAAISAKAEKVTLEKTNKQVQEEILAAQDNLDKQVAEINANIQKLESRLATAPDRSQEKKDAKLALEKERAALRQAEKDFNEAESEKSAGLQTLIEEFIKDMLKADLTSGQQSDVYDAVQQRLMDESAGVNTVEAVIRQVVAESKFAEIKKSKEIKKETKFEVPSGSIEEAERRLEALRSQVKRKEVSEEEAAPGIEFYKKFIEKITEKTPAELKVGQTVAVKNKKGEIKTSGEIVKITDKGVIIKDKEFGLPMLYKDEVFNFEPEAKKKSQRKLQEERVREHNKRVEEAKARGEKPFLEEEKQAEQPELDIPADVQEKADEDWVENYAEEYGNLAYRMAKLQQAIKKAPKKEIAELQKTLDFVIARQAEMENEFVEKWRKEADETIAKIGEQANAVFQEFIGGKKGEEVFKPQDLVPSGLSLTSFLAEIIGTEVKEISFTRRSLKHLAEKGELGKRLFNAIPTVLDNPEEVRKSQEDRFIVVASIQTSSKKPLTGVVLEIQKIGDNIVVSAFPTDKSYLNDFELVWRTPTSKEVPSLRISSEEEARGRRFPAHPPTQKHPTKISITKGKEEVKVDKKGGEEDNKGNGEETNNRGGGVDGKGVSETLPLGRKKPGNAGGTVKVARKGDEDQSAKRGGKFGERSGARLTNEEIDKAVTSVTFIETNGEVTITGKITDDILDAANQYTPGGAAKEGRGILDEYYTESQVVDMVKSLIDFPAKDLRVIEPSVGTGNFLYAIPEIGNHKVAALEINPTTARIAKIFHPSVKVLNSAFETLFIDERGKKTTIMEKNLADLVIGNPPYGEHRGKYLGLGEEKGIKKYEDYFLKRGIDMLKEGGTLAMVVPSGFLDTGTDAVKQAITKNAELVQAFRLPVGIFKGTEIGTDIVIFKKKASASSAEQNERLVLVSRGRYFEQNSQNILGEVKERKNRFGQMEKYVEGDLESAQALFEQHRNDSKAKKILKELGVKPTPENIEEANEAIEEAGKGAKVIIKEGENAEKRIGKKTIQKVTKTAVKKKDIIVSLTSQFVDIPDTELELWHKTNQEGYVENPTEEDKKSLNLMSGKWYLDFNYLQGDIYEKLAFAKSDLSNDKAQYAIQKAKLEAVLPAPERIADIKITPNHTFVSELKFGEETLRSKFLAWIQELPRQAFGDSSTWEVREYVKNEIVNGGDKDHNELVRKRRKTMADSLFKKYLSEELNVDDQRFVEDSYNQTFNFYHTPDYSKVPMFSEINESFKGSKLELNAAQKEGIGRLVNRGVGLLAHEVGFGKTLSGVLAAHETMKRGWAKKPLIITPNENVLNQWVKTIQDTVPNVELNILGNLGISYKGDLSTLKIPEGSFTLLTYEGLKRLSFKDETYARMAGKFQYIADDLTAHKSKRGEAQAEEQAKGTAGTMKKGTRSDLFFEDLGFDHFTFDEVHNANHIVSKAKIEKGQASEYSRFSMQPSDLGIKTWLVSQYIQEKMNGRNVNLLSATPFTNHPLEYYSILSLIADKSLQKMRLQNVNDFFGVFMEANHEYEFKADGTYKTKTDIRSIRNYRQWKNLLGAYIDFKQDAPGIKRPNRVQMTYEVPQNKLTQEMNVKAQSIFEAKESEQGKGAKVLRAINEFRKIAFSPYASKFSPEVRSEQYKEIIENSPKLAVVMGIVAQNKKDRPEAGQIIYSEVGVDFFTLLKNHLVKVVGFKSEEVEIITGKTAKPTRIAIQDKFNAGEVKVLIGSEAITEGMNLQENTTDIHLLSLPWNFTALRQVIGRAWRQGNGWNNIRVNQYFIQDSIDVFLSQKLDNKQRRYEAAIASNENEVDVGDVSYNEMKSELIQDPEKRAKFEIEAQKEKIKADIVQAQAELAFATRKMEKINDLLGQIKKDEKSLATETEEWWKERLAKNIKENKKEYDKELAKLKEKDIDIESLLNKRAEGDKRIAELKAQAKTIEATYDVRLKEIVATLPKREFFSQDTLDKFVAERAEHNKTFYKTAEAPVEETVSVEAQVKEIKNAAGTKVVKTKKTTRVVKTTKTTPKREGTKDQRVLNVLANRELDAAQKVNEILNVKQEGKEFKDTRERVAGSKKERAAINTVLENGDVAVIAEMIKTLGADVIAETLHKDKILEDAVKPDAEQDKTNKVPAFVAGWKQKVFNSIGRTPTLISKEKGRYGGYIRHIPEDAILPFLANYADYLREFVKELDDVKTHERANAFREAHRWYFRDNLPISEEAKKEAGNNDYSPGAKLEVLGRTIKSAIDDIQPYTRILQDIVDVKKILADGVIINKGWSDGKVRYESVNKYGEGTRIFETKKEAEEDLKENRTDAEEMMLKRETRLQNDYDYYLPKKKVRDDNVDLSHANFKPLERVVRSEPDIPDKKINPETLTKEMGFKSIQLGNYMDDPTAKEHIRYVIGAIKDLSKIFGIDFPKLFNKIGLSLALGARGGGRANAHYEPHHNIINLTKGKGDGSFFHEIIHGLDEKTNQSGYRKKWSGGKTRYYSRERLDDTTLDLMQALTGDKIRKVKEFVPHDDAYVLDDKENWVMQARADGRTFEDVVATAKNKQYPGRDFQAIADVYRKNVKEELDVWNEKTNYYAASLAIGKGNVNSYWVRPHELLARAGQAYLEDKMIAAGIKNNYLTRTTLEHKAYPQGEERKIFNTYFDKVFAELSRQYPIEKAIEGELPKEPRFKISDFFQEKPKVVMTEAEKYLADVKKRLNLDFDVYFADAIIAAWFNKKTKEALPIEAWGAIYDNTMLLTKEMAKHTASHEVVHITMANMEKIEIFGREGITREKVLDAKAAQTKIQRNKINDKKIEEKLALDFENYLENKHAPKGIIYKFFAILKTALIRVARAIVSTKGSVVKDYYDILDEGVALEEEYVRIENNGIIQSFVEAIDGDILDFSSFADTKFKLKKEPDKRMQNLKARFNDLVNKQTELEQNSEAWKTDLVKEIVIREETAKLVSGTPERITGKFGKPGLIRFTKRTPPVGELTERGVQEVESLDFANTEEAQQKINDYLQRRTQLISTRNRLRELRLQISQSRSDKKINQSVLRDIERKLKLRKRYLEQKDYYVGMGIGRGKKEQMKMIRRRGRAINNIQDQFVIGDKRAKDIIGGRKIHFMTNREFDDFLLEFYNRAELLSNQLTAQDEVKAIIMERQFGKWENLQKAMELPPLTLMTEKQARGFLDSLSAYQFGDVFLTQRELETIHRTDWGNIKTERELLAKIKENMGFGIKELKTLTARNVGEYTPWIRLTRKHPFFNWLVGKRVEAIIQAEREYTSIEEEVNYFARAARASRRQQMGISERVVDMAIPTDDIVFGYLEAADKKKYATDKKMTEQELNFASYLITQYFNAYEYLNSEYGVRGRRNYMTHIRRSFFETLKGEGIARAFREIFASQKEEEAAFKILDEETGNILAFEKFFGYALRQSGTLVPSKNVARSALGYFQALAKKRAMDKFIPEAMVAVQAHKAVVGTTEKGLTKDPTLEKFVKEFLNDAKGRKIKFITKQGSISDIALRAMVSWTSLKYLGLNLAPAIGNIFGDFTAIYWELSIREQARGLARSIFHPLQAHNINQQFRFFTGRNPIMELFDPKYGLPERLKKSLMTLMGIAAFQTNKFFLRAKMNDEEFRTGVLEDARLKDIALALSRVKPNKFYVKSLAGNTTAGNATFQFGSWAVVITNTILSDGQEVAKMLAARDLKKALTSREAQKFLKFAIMAGILAWMVSLIDVDDDDYTLWGRTMRSVKQNLNTLVEALKFTADITNYALIVKEIMLWGTALKQIYTQEQYKTDGMGYEIGDPKWIRTGERIITPSVLRQFQSIERGDAKERLIQEAIKTGVFNAEEIAKAISPDWNDPEKMKEESKKRKIESVQMLYNVRKFYPDSKVADILIEENENDKKIKAMLEYGKQVGNDAVYSELLTLYRNKNTYGNPRKRTGGLVSKELLKAFQIERRKQ